MSTFTIPDVMDEVKTGEFKGVISEIVIQPSKKRVRIEVSQGYIKDNDFKSSSLMAKNIILENADYDSFMTTFKADLKAIEPTVISNWG